MAGLLHLHAEVAISSNRAGRDGEGNAVEAVSVDSRAFACGGLNGGNKRRNDADIGIKITHGCAPI